MSTDNGTFIHTSSLVGWNHCFLTGSMLWGNHWKLANDSSQPRHCRKNILASFPKMSNYPFTTSVSPLRRPDAVAVCSLCPVLLSAGDHSGGLGGDHVLCDGRAFVLQLHLLHPADYCKYKYTLCLS